MSKYVVTDQHKNIVWCDFAISDYQALLAARQLCKPTDVLCVTVWGGD